MRVRLADVSMFLHFDLIIKIFIDHLLCLSFSLPSNYTPLPVTALFRFDSSINDVKALSFHSISRNYGAFMYPFPLREIK